MNDAYDPLTGFVRCANGGIIKLSRTQGLLFSALLAASGRPLTPDQIIDAGWGHKPDADAPLNEIGTIRVHMHHLAIKLAACSGHIENIWGVGYRLVGKFDVMKPAAGNCPCCGRPMPDNPALTN